MASCSITKGAVFGWHGQVYSLARVLVLMLLTAICCPSAHADANLRVPYKQVRPLFVKHCLSCHDAKQAEGKLVMETYALLMKGGEDGPAIIPGKPDQSPLIQQVEHTEKPFM